MSWAFHTPNLVWQVLTVLSLVYTSIFLFPYLLKLVLYPRKACEPPLGCQGPRLV